MNLTWILCLLLAYLCGSIPFGLLIGLARGVDIRQHGSKNIGATNAGRVLGRRWGFIAFALDVAKGAAPVLVAGWLLGFLGRADLEHAEALRWLAIAAAGVLGHMHSLFLRFKGGKGVATGFGVMAGMWGSLTIPAALALVIWVIVVRLTRFVSVASCIAAASIPLTVLAFAIARKGSAGVHAALPFLIITTLLASAVVWKHRANLARLRQGTEPRIALFSGRPREPEHK